MLQLSPAGLSTTFGSASHRPPAVPPVGKGRLPSRCPYSAIGSSDEDVELICIPGDAGDGSAGRGESPFKVPPTVPPIREGRLPRGGHDLPVDVCAENV